MVRAVHPLARFARPPEPSQARAVTPDYGAAADQLRQIRVPYLHDLGFTGRGVLVCLLDTGFYRDHESLRDLPVVAERDFVFGDNDTQRDPSSPEDYSDSHGTAVWSALGGNGPGHVVGPAYGASFLLAKTEDLRYELPIEEDHWVAAVEWADSAGADVVSSSLSYTVFDDGSRYSFDDLDGDTAVTTIAADRAASLGIAVVIAAGNYGSTSWGHIGTPADGDSVIAVGAVDASGAIASFSSPGPTADGRIKPEVCARGVATACASNATPSSYGSSSGTSLSTPLVAGVAALLLEANPTWAGADVREALMATADRASSPDNRHGWGIVDAFAASGVQAPIILTAGAVINDDDDGESIGNGNGMVEPGERVEISLSLANDGSADSGELTCALSTQDEAVGLVRSTVTVASLSPGDTAQAGQTLVFDYAPWGPVDTSVSFSLSVRGAMGDTLARTVLVFPVVRLHLLLGSVVETGASTVSGATVRVVPAGESPIPDTLEVDAGGIFSVWRAEGVYALQARAPGFISPDALTVLLPGDDAAILELSRPRMVTSPDIIAITLVADSSATTQLTVGNTGTGILRCVSQGAPQGGPTRWRDSFVNLRADPREGGSPDLVRLTGSATGETLRLRLHAGGVWSAGDVTLRVGLDVDGEPGNGRDAAGLDADYALEWDGDATLLEAIGGRWITVTEIEASLADSVLTLAVPTSLIGSLTPMIRLAAAVERDGTPSPVLLDRLPDDGGTDPVVWHLHAPTWLQDDQEELAIAPGAWAGLTVSVDTHGLEPGAYRAEVVFQGGFEAGDPVPILLTVTGSDSVPSDRPAALELCALAPNPASDEFHARIGLPAPAPVVLELIDVAGRRLAQWAVGTLPAGWSSVTVPFAADSPRGAFWLRVTTPLGNDARILVRN
jgi:hypothetical protein